MENEEDVVNICKSIFILLNRMTLLLETSLQ